MTPPSSLERVDAVLTYFLQNAGDSLDQIDAEYDRVRKAMRKEKRPTPDRLHLLLDIERRRERALARYHAGREIQSLISR